MRVCVALARSVKPNVDIGICGEHGGKNVDHRTNISSCHVCHHRRPRLCHVLPSYRAGQRVLQPLPSSCGKTVSCASCMCERPCYLVIHNAPQAIQYGRSSVATVGTVLRAKL